jgi:hypothetical protein
MAGEDIRSEREPAETRGQEPLDIYVVVMGLMEQMAAISWQKLGLQPDIMTGRVEQDMAQARIAIDLTAHLAGILEPKLDEDDKRRIQGLVRDLRINWVEKNTEVGR